MINILLWIVFGGVAGWVASMVTGNEGDLGLVGNVIVGIIGAFVGGFIVDKLAGRNFDAERPTSIVSFIVAVIGAVVLLAIINLVF
jgi:uncharacterized membrane protein YeaQ/YmgE (transglycosylase-associated protein family)